MFEVVVREKEIPPHFFHEARRDFCDVIAVG